ncbi:LuxR C-terminal-related transcriptional regulator [Polymorphobacter megasporae]|nr:LuxR C-terminal-related transcriptional regulator [Polymorphobacter megasporae]
MRSVQTDDKWSVVDDRAKRGRVDLIAIQTDGAASSGATRDSDVPGRVHLTPTQRKVLDGVHSGRLNKQIAFDLGVAEATVKAHMTILMRKLNVRNRTQVAVVAQMISAGL